MLIDELALLHVAGRGDRARVAMVIEAARVPLESAKFYHLARDLLGTVHEVFVTHLEERRLYGLAPVRLQTAVFAMVKPEGGEIIGIRQVAAEVLEITGETGVERIAHAMDHARDRKQ